MSRPERRAARVAAEAQAFGPNYRPPGNTNLQTSPGKRAPNANANLNVSQGTSRTNQPVANTTNNAVSGGRRRPHSDVSNNFMRNNLRNVTTPPLCVGKGAFGEPAFDACFDAAFATLWKAHRGSTTAPCSALVPHKDQVRLYETAKAMARANTTNRGQLVWANTGAGKTVMALCIILAYWSTDYRIVVVTTKANLDQNGPKEYIKNMGAFFPEVAKELDRRRPGWRDTAFLKHTTGTAAENNAKVIFYTALKFVNNVVGKDDGTQMKAHEGVKIKDGGKFVVILDEAHQILEPPAQPKGLAEEMAKLKRELLSRKFATTNVHVWPLTATPASNVPMWLEMLSFVRPVNADPVPKPRIKEVLAAVQRTSVSALQTLVGPYTRGTVFVSDLRDDLTRHACVTYDPKRVPMDRWYYLAWLATVQALRAKKATNHEVCRTTMYLERNEYLRVIPADIKTEITRRHRLLGTTWVSNKFIAIVKDIANLSQNRGKVFVYSPHVKASGPVITLIAKALEQWFGFRNVTGTVVAAKEETPYVNTTQRPCFVMYGERKTKEKVTQANDTPKAKLRWAFNHASNANGRHIKVYLAAGDEYEGTDLNNIRHLHITEPMLNPLKERQLVGRGVRYCSHALTTLPKTVRVVRWYGAPPATDAANLLQRVDKKGLNAVRTALASRINSRQGLEKDLHIASLKAPAAVALYNFEIFLKKQAVRGYAGTFKDMFLPPAGRVCP